jgi:diaminopimelate epimerase
VYIDFEKWHGAKNDFLVTWILTTERDLLIPTLERLSPAICARDGGGVAADGILVIIHRSRKDHLPEELVIINSDGSIAKNCGNGLRCAARSVRSKAESLGVMDLDGVTFNVQGREINCRYLGKSGSPFVAVTMPVPVVGDEIPWHGEAITSTKQLQSSTPGLKGEIQTVDIGNPHIVISVAAASADLAKTAGSSLQIIRGGDGVNLHLSESLEMTNADQQRARRDIGEEIGELVKVTPFERGAGLTMACGTGACAVGVSMLSTGLSERDLWIGVDMPGGRLYVKQDREDDPVILAGPAQFVFSGRLEI